MTTVMIMMMMMCDKYETDMQDKNLARVGDKACNHFAGSSKADMLPEKKSLQWNDFECSAIQSKSKSNTIHGSQV